MTRDDAESPELTLVSPELREAARSRLPDRPWEVPLQGGGPPRDARAVVQPPEHEPPNAVPERRQAGSPDAQRSRTQRLARWLPVAVVTIGGLLLWMTWQGSTDPGIDSVLAPQPKPPAQPASPAPRDAPRARLLGNAGYVVSPSGSFLTSASGRRIRSFTLPLRCGEQPLVIRAVAISGASFRFRGRAVGRAAVVELSARVLDRSHVRGRVGARGPSCRADAISFSARVS